MIHNININIEGGAIETKDLFKQLNDLINLLAKREEISAVKARLFNSDGEPIGTITID
jgi:hypothetical protein